MRQHLHDPVHQDGHHPRGAVQRVPPVLHRQAEAGGQRWPRRAVPAPLRPAQGLDRRLSERRLYPAIDVNASSTRHEELLFERGQLQQVWKLRRVLNALASDGKDAAGLELLMDKIRTTKSNDEFLAEIAKGPAA